MTTSRLAVGGPPKALKKALMLPTVRLADVGAGRSHIAFGNEIDKPALLVSYFYLKQFQRHRPNYHFRDWVMDSGAYSAHNSGAEIDLDEYIETCRHLLETDPKLTEVFALDVIGDWRASIKNCEKMWEAGIPAIPAFHPGEPEEALAAIARDYPKIALGGLVGKHNKYKKKWLSQCFTRVWPKKIHGFGIASRELLLSLPFHSTDATNWELTPCAFGTWKSFGKMSVRGGEQNLRAEVEWYMRLERECRAKWAKEMKQLEDLECN